MIAYESRGDERAMARLRASFDAEQRCSGTDREVVDQGTEVERLEDLLVPLRSRALRTVPPIQHDHEGEHEGEHVHVETIEHEIVDFDGCSEAEVKAKVQDFYAWAS